MKKVTKKKVSVNTVTVKNLLKKGFKNTKKILVYKRISRDPSDEQYAFLRRVNQYEVGFVSLDGGSHYVPAFVEETYLECVKRAFKQRKLYQFKNLQEFLDQKDDIKWFRK